MKGGKRGITGKKESSSEQAPRHYGSKIKGVTLAASKVSSFP